MNDKFSDYIKKRVSEQNSILSRPLRHSNSDTNLTLYKLSKKHDKGYQTENYNLEKYKFKKRYATSSLRLNKMLRKDKRRLSDYIVNNPKYVKLYGNKRYLNNPLLFVQDHKKKIDDSKIGLIPVPLKKKKKIKTIEEHKQLYDLQRSIVMMRRFQYNRKYSQNLNFYQKQINMIDVIRIQRWWRRMKKIILIQATYRGRLLRKEVQAVNKLFLFMNGFENTLLKIFCKKAMFYIKKCEIVVKKRNKAGIITKTNYLVNTKLRKKLIKVQSIIRQHHSINKRYEILRTFLKYFPLLNKFYITKTAYSNKRVNEIIKGIQRKWRKYCVFKSLVIKKIILPDVIRKDVISRPTYPAKLIQNFIRRHHYFVCNDKNKSGYFPKEKSWNFFTRKIINDKVIDSVFIKPKSNYSTDSSNDNIKTLYFYTQLPGYISKKRYSDIKFYTSLIQKHSKKFFAYKKENQSLGLKYYISKTYVKVRVQNLIKFILILNHTMKVSTFRKRIKYVPQSNYSHAEINKIRTIQMKYKNHYYTSSFNIKQKEQNEIGYFSIHRFYDNQKQLTLIQTKSKSLAMKNINYINSIVHEKPKSKLCALKKKYIKVVKEKVSYIQFKYRSHYIIKKLKEERDDAIYKYRVISRKNNMFTKKIVGGIKKLELIKNLQCRYHQRYDMINSNLLQTPEIMQIKNKLHQLRNKEKQNKKLRNQNNLGRQEKNLSSNTDNFRNQESIDNKGVQPSSTKDQFCQRDSNGGEISNKDNNKKDFNNNRGDSISLIDSNDRKYKDINIESPTNNEYYQSNPNININDYLKDEEQGNENELLYDINLSLYSLLQKNKKPLYDTNKYYLTKKRVDIGYGYVYSFSYITPTKLKIIERGYIDKERYRNNLYEIIKIQNNFRKQHYLTRSMVSRSHYLTNKTENDLNILKKRKNSYQMLKAQIGTNKDEIEKPSNAYDTESIFNHSNSFYITKKRIRNCKKEIATIQNVYSSYSSQKKEEKQLLTSNQNLLCLKFNINSICYISKIRIDSITLHQYYNEIKEKSISINPQYQYRSNKLNNYHSEVYKEISYITKERKSDIVYYTRKIQNNFRKYYNYQSNIVQNEEIVNKKCISIGYVTKKRKSNFEYQMNKLLPLQQTIKTIEHHKQQNKNIQLKLIDVYKRNITKPCILTKERFRNNEKQIRLIQDQYKIYDNKGKNELYNTISRKYYSLCNPNSGRSEQGNISDEDRINKIKGINVTSKPKTLDIGAAVIEYGTYGSNYESNNKNCGYITKVVKKTIHNLPMNNIHLFISKTIYQRTNQLYSNIKVIQKETKDYLSKKKKFNQHLSSLKKSNENVYIPPFIFPKQISNDDKVWCYMTKKNIRIIHTYPNLSFINLMCILSTKNAQEYFFNLLKFNSFMEDSSFSFYYNALYRTIKFILTNPEKGKKVSKFMNKLLNLQNDDGNKNNKPNKRPETIISSLSKDQIKQLQSTNIYSSFEQDFIDYLTSFSKYDKKLSNETFITERLKLSKIINTNIFSMVKFLDEEYNNLINGKYCNKCYLSIESCHCTKKSTDVDEEEGFDVDIPNDEFTAKSLINHFEYDSTKVKGVLIKRKPKIEEAYEDPITHMIINTKKNEGVMDNKSDNKSVDDDKTIESGGTSEQGNNNIIKESKKDTKEMDKIRKILHKDRTDKKRKQLVIRDNTYLSGDLN